MDAIEPILKFGLDTQWTDLPEDVIERTRLAILDTIASALPGARGHGLPELTSLVTEWGGAPQATLLTSGRKVPAPLATLVNGVAARAWDLDDVHEQNTCHVNANTVPAALAVAEARGPVNGRDFMLAVALGTEAICRVSAAPRLSFSETGMANSYQSGYFGTALAASRLLGLDIDRARHAMGIAYARVAGNQQGYVDGAMTVRLMQGVAPEGGVIAALMAERGITGSSKVLEGKFGYFPTYQRGVYEPKDLTVDLGTLWRSLEISIKPVYPCCKFTHGPMEAMLDAMARADISHEEIERVVIDVTNREVYDLICEIKERKWNPITVVDCQFSLPYTVAYVAVNGMMSLEAFQPEGMADARVRAFMARIDARLDVEAQGSGRGKFPMPGIVEIRTKGGRISKSTVTYVKGHPKNAMDFEDVADKTRACARFAGFDESQTERLISFVRELENQDDVSRLAELASPSPRRLAA